MKIQTTATKFELWANKWCFEMSGKEEVELRERFKNDN